MSEKLSKSTHCSYKYETLLGKNGNRMKKKIIYLSQWHTDTYMKVEKKNAYLLKFVDYVNCE